MITLAWTAHTFERLTLKNGSRGYVDVVDNNVLRKAMGCIFFGGGFSLAAYQVSISFGAAHYYVYLSDLC